MGSLFSFAKPKAPQTQTPKVVYVPAASSGTDAPTSSTSANSGADAGTAQTEAEMLQARAENLLRRNRSRLGTVLTGFRGVLAPNDLAAQRKTLLGE
jgi:hypothetical protein